MSVQLPDGGKLGTSGGGVEPTDMGGLSIPMGGPSITIPNLPTITEQSVTAPPKDERHRSIKEVFADNDEENDDEEAEDTPAQLPITKPPPRLRTTSESPHKFIVKPVINQNGAKRGSCGPTDAMTRQVLSYQHTWILEYIITWIHLFLNNSITQLPWPGGYLGLELNK